MTTSSETPTRWWLALNGRPDGPRTIAYVTAGLQSGQLSHMTPVCPEGGSEWRPLGTWPTLASLTSSSTLTPPPPPPGAGIGGVSGVGTDHLLTNPALPPMANLICVSTILVYPLLWMLGLVELLNFDNPFLDGTSYYWIVALQEAFTQFTSLALTILLSIAGARLRDLKASGERWLRLGLSFSLILEALLLVFAILLMILGGMAGAYEETQDDPVSFWALFSLFMGLAMLAWSIVMLVWLVRNRTRLPLQSHI